jgi:hypothetical protein
MRTGVVVVAAAIILIAPLVWAYSCPVVIKQAEDLVKKTEAGKVSPETEAKAHHEAAKTKRDHGDAVRTARTAVAFAEEALFLQSP